MARKQNIKYLLKRELDTMASYGRSKHKDQVQTRQERHRARAQGISYNESLKIDYTKNHIYSYTTMELYQKAVNRFAEYLCSIGKNKITLAEAKEYIPDYLLYLEEKGLAATTIHSYLAGICKATHTYMVDYEHPRRSIAEITKGTAPFNVQNIKNSEVLKTLEANRLLGLRRNELLHLKAKDIIEKDGMVIVHTIGKGGKHNQQVFIWEEEKKAVLMLKQGKNIMTVFSQKKTLITTVIFTKCVSSVQRMFMPKCLRISITGENLHD